MGTLMAEVQNRNTSGNMWKKCSMPLKAHELLLADLNTRCQKIIDFYGCFYQRGFGGAYASLHCQRHGTFLVLPLPEEIQKGHKFCSESVSDRRWSGKENRISMSLYRTTGGSLTRVEC